MHIADKEPHNVRFFHAPSSSFARDNYKTRRTEYEGAPIHIDCSSERLQRITAFPRGEDELRTEKVDRIKKQIAQGTYNVEAIDVAKAILRNGISLL